MKSSTVKKSLVLGGLISSSGFLIAKFLGIFYSVPFSYILGSSELMSYYGTAYRIYSYILSVFTAGLPFATATLVAKYAALGNWKTVRSVNRLSLLISGMFGFLGMVLMMALSYFLSIIMTEGTDGRGTMTAVLCILAFAVFFVPLLSSYRGFIQGCKDMEEYAFSQTFEQLFRIGFLLSVACLLVYGFGLGRVWALYAGVASTSVAAIAGILQIRRYVKARNKEIDKLTRMQKVKMVAASPLMKEFILLAIPYFMQAVLGYSDDIFNAVLLPIGLKSHSPETYDVVMSTVNYVGTKLTAIPMILAPGFTAAIIPHISTALTEKNYALIRRNIVECLSVVLFIGLFLTFCIFFYSRQLNYVLFLTEDLDLSSRIIKWASIEGFLGTIAPVLSSIMMVCGLRRSLLKRMAISAVLKGILLVPFSMWWGFPGAVVATVISYGYLLTFNAIELSFRYKVSFVPAFRTVLCTLIGLAFMALCGWLLFRLGLSSTGSGRMMCLALTVVNGLVSTIVFLAVELYLHVPQRLFHFRLKRSRKARA